MEGFTSLVSSNYRVGEMDVSLEKRVIIFPFRKFQITVFNVANLIPAKLLRGLYRRAIVRDSPAFLLT